MLVFSCVVLATPFIVAASGGVSPPAGIFKGLLSPFGPQLPGLNSDQTLVSPECLSICYTFSATRHLHHQLAHGAIINQLEENEYMELPCRSAVRKFSRVECCRAKHQGALWRV